MREILFRGQTRRFGEKVRMNGEKVPSNWVYGGICHGKGDFSIIYGDMDAKREKPIEKFVVYTDTVGQYTGLTDKNGKKIFEGDILAGDDYPFTSDSKHNYFAEVVWFDNCPAFGIITHINPKSNIRGISDGNTDFIEDFESIKWEVIGNIYDNPELLKRSNDNDL